MLRNKTKQLVNRHSQRHTCADKTYQKTSTEHIELATKREFTAKRLKRKTREPCITNYAHVAFCIDGRVVKKEQLLPEIASHSGTPSLYSECDASGLPHGGARSTTSAGGLLRAGLAAPYVIDNTLCLASGIFCPNGTSLDCITPLARSCNVLSEECRKLLALLGYKPKIIFPAVGAEQEFFLLDATTAQARRDVTCCGRSLLIPTSPQHAASNYLAPLPERIKGFFDEVTRRLRKINIDVTTVHSEGAPHQYELVTRFENATSACVHSMIAMQVLQSTAQRHGLLCLFDEKPFLHTSGSGKHSNWSIFADNLNLIDPRSSPPIAFALLLSAIIQAFDIYGDIIFATVDSASNQRRLGKNEAPPSVPSVCIGDEMLFWLSSVPAAITPPPLGLTERNRTAPVVFTKNKLELRVLGSNGAIAELNTALNTAVATVLRNFTRELRTADVTRQAQRLIKRTLDTHGNIVFNGDHYAKYSRRPKPPYSTQLLQAARCLSSPKAEKLFAQAKVLSHEELLIRAHCRVKSHIDIAANEAIILLAMLQGDLLPSARNLLNDRLALCDRCSAHKLPCAFLHKHILRLSSLSECAAARIGLLQTALRRLLDHAEEYNVLTLDDTYDSNTKLTQAYVDVCTLTEKAGRLAYQILHILPGNEKPFAADCELLS